MGLLTVKELVATKRYATRFRYFYRCDCDCGGEKIIERHNLTSAHAKSCGCLRKRSGAKSPSWSGHRNAQDNERTFNITIEYAWKIYQKQKGFCALTGVKLSLESEDRTASLDRIDNEIGYEVGNVQWIHRDG